LFLLLRFSLSLLFVGIFVRLFPVRLGRERYSLLIYFGFIMLFLSSLAVPVNLVVQRIAVFRLVAVLFVTTTATTALREYVTGM